MDTPPEGRAAGHGDAADPAAQEAWSRFADRRGGADEAAPTPESQERWWGRQWIPVTIAALVAIVLIVAAVVWWRSDSDDAVVGHGPQLAVGPAVACWIDDGGVRCADADEGRGWTVDTAGQATSVALSRSQLCVSAEDETVDCRLLVSADDDRDRGRTVSTGLDTPPVSVAAGLGEVCALDAQGTVWCWAVGDDPEPVDLERSAVALTAGAKHVCALDDHGAVWCWGAGSDGRLGDGLAGADHHRDTPTRVMLDDRITAIAAGSEHTCALDDQGRARCWGGGLFGQLGTGELPASGVPTEVAGGHRFDALAAGGFGTCALDDQDAVWCWGDAGAGADPAATDAGDGGGADAGDGDEAPEATAETLATVPRPITLDGAARHVATGGEQSCAQLDDGSVQCWGAGFGAPGDPDTPAAVSDR